MEEIIIQKRNGSVIVCVLENGQIVEKYNFEIDSSATIGNIYIGTVKDIFEGMQAAFVDIGLEKKAFLPFKDALPKVDMVKDDKQEEHGFNVREYLKKDKKLLLQIRKEAIEDKGARVSTHVTLAGNYLVLMPETDIVTISQKIIDVQEKERLLSLVKKGIPKGFGCIIRTEAEGVSDDELIEDFKKILKTWEEIKDKFEDLKLKDSFSDNERLIYNDNDVVMKIARDMVRRTTKKVYVNDKEIYEILNFLICSEIVEFNENKDFIDEFGLITEFEKIDNRKIWLKCGAQIVIDKTEALTAIDVNSSRCVHGKDLEDTIFKINQEAAIEIMKQLRLKDIGGIVIIDFIDMHNQEYKDEILRIMREEQRKDRSKIEVKDFTQLNLVEMTRKKMYV